MNDSSIIIKELISFLTDVFRGKEIKTEFKVKKKSNHF